MKTRPRSERGSALLVAVVITLVVIAISGAFISHSMVRHRNSTNSMLASQALTAAEAGAALYLQDLNKTYWGAKASPPVVVAAPAGYRHGFLGSPLTVADAHPNRIIQWVNQSFYRIWYEALGSNAVDDNGDGATDETAENVFGRLWVEGYAGGRADLSDPLAPKYVGGVRRTIEVVVTQADSDVYDFGLFAGNSTGQPYTMVFNSNGSSRDRTQGDVYSGGSINVGGSAELLNGQGSNPASRVMYKDSRIDTSSAADPSYVQGVQPIPDIAGGNYAAKAAAGSLDRYNKDTNPTGKYVNVKEDLETYGATNGSNNNGGMTLRDGSQQDMGKAQLQVYDKDNPAHMFRLEPSTSISNQQKRVQGYSGMNPDKPNYFLEDPTKTANNGGTALDPWGQQTGNSGLRVELTPASNEKVYYIDGNLWASNGPAYTFQWLNNTGSDMKITIVVQGNVYLTDNLIYDKAAKASGRNDALAIIAINDPNHPSMNAADLLNPASSFYNHGGMATANEQARINYSRDYNKLHGSGNIFFGDPGGGTTERFESYMYAQNNFYDNNLSASGTVETNIYGNMTAGNHIHINRTQNAFRPLKVQYDNRVSTGQVSLPGLPASASGTSESWKIVSWRQVARRPESWGSVGSGMVFNPE